MLISFFLQFYRWYVTPFLSKIYFDFFWMIFDLIFMSVNAVALKKWSISVFRIYRHSKVVYRWLNIWWVFLVCGVICAKLTLEKICQVGKNLSDVEEKLHFLLWEFQKMPCLVVGQCVEMETEQEVPWSLSSSNTMKLKWYYKYLKSTLNSEVLCVAMFMEDLCFFFSVGKSVMPTVRDSNYSWQQHK